MSAKGASMPNEKSVIWAYILWLFGGIFGVHHFYLRRDRHAFVWWSTLGGFGIGWLGEVFRIPRYVRDANEHPEHMQELAKRMFQNKKPPFSMNRFTGMLMVGYSWAQMMMMAVPPDEFWGINFRYLNYLVPFVAALGVWTVGNIGREEGSFKWPLLAAYVAYPVRYYIYDESVWFTIMVLASALAFDSFSKQWRRKPRAKKHMVKRLLVLGVCAALYAGLWCGYLYFHGTVTDSDGDEVPVYEALHHFFTSPWWLDVKQCLMDTYQFAQHHGWYEVWKQIIELSDPHGEQNAYKQSDVLPSWGLSWNALSLLTETQHGCFTIEILKGVVLPQTYLHKVLPLHPYWVLGLGPEASQQEITARWRRLSRDNHPDKVKDENLRREAQDKFMEIQRAYEILSSSKHRRNRRNKKDNTEYDAIKIEL